MPTTPMGIPYPSSTDDVQLWTKFQAQATALETLLNLPSPVSFSTGGIGTIVSAAGAWAAVPAPGGPCEVSITNPSSTYKLVVDVCAQAWLSASGGTGNVQGMIVASGGLTWAGGSFGSGGAISNGENMFFSVGASGISASSFITAEIPAGAAAVTFALHVLRSVADGTKTVLYPAIRVIPRRFKP